VSFLPTDLSAPFPWQRIQRSLSILEVIVNADIEARSKGG
jgi:hypothetical protein